MPTNSHTWDERNIASATDNGVGDITLTFRVAYAATPAVVFGGGVGSTSATTNAPSMISVSSTSVRFVTHRTAGTTIAAGKVSMIVAGDV